MGRAGSHGGLQTTSAARPPMRPEPRVAHLDPVREPEPVDVVAGADEGARARVRGDDPADSAPGEDGGEHARAGAEVEGDAADRTAGQLRIPDEVDVLAPDRGEHSVVRVDAGAVERGDGHTGAAPFVRAEHTQQLAQRYDAEGSGGGPISLGARAAHVGGAAQVEPVVGVEDDQEHAEDAGAVGAVPAVLVEAVGGRQRPVDAAAEGAQELPGAVVVAAPQQRGAFAGVAVGLPRAGPVVGDEDAPGRPSAAERAPGRGAGGVGFGFGPGQDGHRGNSS